MKDFVRGIKEFAPKEGEGEEQGVVLWLDTLCCLVGPPIATRMALEKIRNVYERAFCVLVLDENLRSYPAMTMTVYEALARIPRVAGRGDCGLYKKERLLSHSCFNSLTNACL